jgi:hypothetical protein
MNIHASTRALAGVMQTILSLCPTAELPTRFVNC